MPHRPLMFGLILQGLIWVYPFIFFPSLRRWMGLYNIFSYQRKTMSTDAWIRKYRVILPNFLTKNPLQFVAYTVDLTMTKLCIDAGYLALGQHRRLLWTVHKLVMYKTWSGTITQAVQQHKQDNFRVGNGNK